MSGGRFATLHNSSTFAESQRPSLSSVVWDTENSSSARNSSEASVTSVSVDVVALRRETSSNVEMEAQELLESLFRDSTVLEEPCSSTPSAVGGGGGGSAQRRRPPPPPSSALPVELTSVDASRICTICKGRLVLGETDLCESCSAQQGEALLSVLTQEEVARSARRMQRLSLLVAGRADEVKDRVGRASIRGDVRHAPTSRPPLIRGELWKKTRGERGAFKKRYFVQSGPFLYYVKQAGDWHARDRFALQALREVSKHIDAKWGLCCALVFPERVLLVSTGKNADGPEVREWIDRFSAWQKWFDANPNDVIEAGETITYEPQQKKGWKAKWLGHPDDEPTIPAKKEVSPRAPDDEGGGSASTHGGGGGGGSRRASPRFLSLGRRQGQQVVASKAVEERPPPESSFPGIRLRESDLDSSPARKAAISEEQNKGRPFRKRGSSVSKDELVTKRESPRDDLDSDAGGSPHLSPRGGSPRGSHQGPKSRAGSVIEVSVPMNVLHLSHGDAAALSDAELAPRVVPTKPRAASGRSPVDISAPLSVLHVRHMGPQEESHSARPEPAIGSPRSLGPAPDDEPPIPRKTPLVRKTADSTPSVQKITSLRKRSDVTNAASSTKVSQQDSPESKAEQLIIAVRLHGHSDLDISMMGLKGLAPGALSGLPSVRFLDLSFNRLTTWPEEALMSLAGHLQVLVLAGCNIEMVPKSIKLLPQLRELVLSGNGLVCLPAEIAACRKLQTLNLSDNRLKDIPASIGYLERLEELFLRGNPSLGSLPSSIGNLRELQMLDASSCNLATIPEEIVYCTQLMDLNLRANHLSSLPALMGWLRKLISLNVAMNMLTDVPLSLGLCENLNHVGLGLNIKGNPIENPELVSIHQEGAEQLAAYLARRYASAAAAAGGGGGGGADIMQQQEFPTSWPYVAMKPVAGVSSTDEALSPRSAASVTALPQAGRSSMAIRSAVETVISRHLLPVVARLRVELDRIDSVDGRSMNALGRRLKAMRVDVESLIALGHLKLKMAPPAKDEEDKLRYMKALLSYHLERVNTVLKLIASNLAGIGPAQVLEIGKAIGRLKIAATTEL